MTVFSHIRNILVILLFNLEALKLDCSVTMTCYGFFYLYHKSDMTIELQIHAVG